MKILKKYLGIILVTLLIIIQFFRIDKTVPEFSEASDFSNIQNTDPSVMSLIQDACYDCHSYKTAYPWYAEIAPVSWWVKNHINVGRDELNFSIWGEYNEGRRNHKLEESIELIEAGSMPLKSFTWLHPEAKMDLQQKQRLMDYFRSLMVK